MNHKTHKTKLKPARFLASIGLICSSFLANAAFLEFVDEDTVQEEIDGSRVVLTESVTSPDGRFTYASGLNGIFIFSRDQVTGNLSQVSVLSGDSYPGGADIVSVQPVDMLVSPDSNHLYMAGVFGYTSGGSEGDAPITWQTTVVKFDRDIETGLLSFNNHIDFGNILKSMSEITFSSDGSLLLLALANGNPGTTEVYLVNTQNMQPLFTLTDAQNDISVLPASRRLKIALSPDEQTVYLGGPGFNNSNKVVPALAVIDIDPSSNRMSVKQTLNEEFFDGVETDVDISLKSAFSSLLSINTTEDGEFFYTFGSIRTAEANTTKSISAIGVWKVEADGTLSLVRSMDKQELVYDVIGGNGEFSFATDLELSPGSNHFVYSAEDQFSDGLSDVTVFSRDLDTGLLTYIDDNVGVKELDDVADVSIVQGGRFFNVIEGGINRAVSVVDTAVDRSLTLNNIASTQTQSDLPGNVTSTVASLQAIVSNNGPTDDYAVEVFIETPSNTVLTSEDENCIEANGGVSCKVRNLLVGAQASFDITATSLNASGSETVSATARSNKIDIDSINDTDAVNINVLTVPSDEEVNPNTQSGGSEPPGNDSGADPLVSTPSNADSGSGGGCSIGGPRTSKDISLLALLLVCAGVFVRRRMPIIKCIALPES